MEEDFKQTIFELARDRLVDRRDSLIRFSKHWQGRGAGIEGWFKLEFVAAIEPHVAQICAGGAGGKGCAGISCPDLILKTPWGTEIPVETKATGERWWYGGLDAPVKYKDHLLAFLSPLQNLKTAKHRRDMEAIDIAMKLAPICEIDGSRTFCFCMLDLRRVATRATEVPPHRKHTAQEAYGDVWGRVKLEGDLTEPTTDEWTDV